MEKIVTDRHICFSDPLNIWTGMRLFCGTNPQNIGFALWNLILCSLRPYLLSHFYANLPDRRARKRAT